MAISVPAGAQSAATEQEQAPTDLVNLGLKREMIARLHRVGIHSISELAQYSSEQLLQLPGIGLTTVGAIEQAFARRLEKSGQASRVPLSTKIDANKAKSKTALRLANSVATRQYYHSVTFEALSGLQAGEYLLCCDPFHHRLETYDSIEQLEESLRECNQKVTHEVLHVTAVTPAAIRCEIIEIDNIYYPATGWAVQPPVTKCFCEVILPQTGP